MNNIFNGLKFKSIFVSIEAVNSIYAKIVGIQKVKVASKKTTSDYTFEIR